MAAPVNRFIVRCLDGCGRLTGTYPTLKAAEARVESHLNIAAQATHTVVIAKAATPVERT